MDSTELLCILPTFDHLGRGLVSYLVFVYKIMKTQPWLLWCVNTYWSILINIIYLDPVACESFGRDTGLRFKEICPCDYKK